MIRRKDKPTETGPPPDGESKMGRPKMADNARRDILIKVLTTEAEYKELEHAAKVACIGVSTWVRMVSLEKARGTAKG